MNKQLKKITIVGGGSAGWMTAIYLNKYFNSEDENFHIHVIESPDVGVIGVGEATVHSIRYFFAAMGLDENELLRETNATLKHGIMFRNWMKPVQGKEHAYFHPFESNQSSSTFDISTAWFLGDRDKIERYDQGVCSSSHMIEEGYSPKSKNSAPFQGLVPYGYHIDAVKMGQFLRRKAVEAGVEHTEATVSSVKVKAGNIEKIITDKGDYCSDIFVDCTGFRALLINELQSDNWNSFEDALPCNRAVAIQKNYDKDTSPRPYTVATALTNGWAWQIDLTNRQGTGYVYDGNRLTEAEAEAELRHFIGEDSDIIKATHLKMNVGCRKAFWIGNCVSIGLSGGFIEPLESTGLHVINIGAKLLATHLSNSKITKTSRDSYNSLMSGVYQDLKQFIVLHYCISDRDDTEFWRQAAKSAQKNPVLENMLMTWKHKICEYLDLAGGYSTTFTDENYRYVLYGMQHYPDIKLSINQKNNDEMFNKTRLRADLLKSKALKHSEYLALINGV